MVFLVSMLSPLTIDNEPVEAHYDEPTDPPLRVQVYINKLYSTEDYDDSVPYFGWLFGGATEIVMSSQVTHEYHDSESQFYKFDWNMDGEGFFDGTPTAHVIDGRTVYEFDMGHREIYNHIECTDRESVSYSFRIVEDDAGKLLQVIEMLVAVGETTAGLVLIGTSALGVAVTGGASTGVSVLGVLKGSAAVAAGVGVMIEIGSSGEYEDQTIGWNPGQELSEDNDGINYVWPMSKGQYGGHSYIGGVGVEVQLVVTPFEVVGPGWQSDAEGQSSCIQPAQIVPSDEIAQVTDYDEIRMNVRNQFDIIRTAYASINASTSLPENWTGPNDNDNCDQINGTGDCDDWNNSQKPPEDPLNNTDPYNSTTHTVDRGLLMTEGNGLIDHVTREFLSLVADVNPDATYPISMDLWYADFLTKGGHYFDALGYYESAIIGSIDAIETAPPPPPATVTIQAEGDDVPEDLFIEIYSGDCGDDCAEEDLVFVGEEGDSEIEASLESGEYTVVMISDGDVYSSDYLEVQSGGDITVLKMSEGAPPQMLDVMFHLQSLIVAALPALVGFAGSRRYLEEKDSTEETTPLWIGAAVFVAVLYMLLG